MKFFTRGLANGEFDDHEDERVSAAYRHHLATILPTSPIGLQAVASLQLHDALVDRVRWSPADRRLSIVLVVFGPEGTFSSVTIDYSGALLGEHRVTTLRRVATNREASVWAHEVDRDGEILAHRFLFMPDDEVTIDCSEVRVSVEPRSDDRVFLHGAFVENS